MHWVDENMARIDRERWSAKMAKESENLQVAKVYAVYYSWKYEGELFVGVFSTREKAEEYVSRQNSTDLFIEETEIDNPVNPFSVAKGNV